MLESVNSRQNPSPRIAFAHIGYASFARNQKYGEQKEEDVRNELPVLYRCKYMSSSYLIFAPSFVERVQRQNIHLCISIVETTRHNEV